MGFNEQVRDLKIVVDRTPRIYLRWNNTEEGRDKNDCYERVELGGTVMYINANNRSSYISKEHPFWATLEAMYGRAVLEDLEA